MNIPASYLLIFGLVAATLFVAVFIGALYVTMRNRSIIRRHTDNRHYKK